MDEVDLAWSLRRICFFVEIRNQVPKDSLEVQGQVSEPESQVQEKDVVRCIFQYTWVSWRQYFLESYALSRNFPGWPNIVEVAVPKGNGLWGIMKKMHNKMMMIL